MLIQRNLKYVVICAMTLHYQRLIIIILDPLENMWHYNVFWVYNCYVIFYCWTPIEQATFPSTANHTRFTTKQTREPVITKHVCFCPSFCVPTSHTRFQNSPYTEIAGKTAQAAWETFGWAGDNKTGLLTKTKSSSTVWVVKVAMVNM